MWTRAELKDRAKMCLSRYYWAAFLVSLIFAILSGFGGSNANTQRITSYLEQNESGNSQTDQSSLIPGALGGDGSTFFLMDAKYLYRILFSMDLWRNIGWDSIMYLAAISSVDLALYEAAEMDGCGKLGKMWHITLPGIRGTIGLLFIMGVGGLLSSGVEQIWLLRTPGNMSLADTLDVYVLRIGIQGGQFGYATAIGLIQGLVGLVLVVVCNRICKKVTEVGLW